MADELTVSISLAYSKGDRKVDFKKGGLQFDVSGTDYTHQTLQVAASPTETAIDIGGITTCGYMAVKNLDATNFVEIRPGSGVADLIKLKAGEVALFRLAMDTPYAIADTAACEIEYLIIEN